MKKQVMKSLSLLSFLLLLISCGTKQKERLYADNEIFYSKFPQEKKLKGEIIELDTAIFRYPSRIRVEGDKAIVMDLHNSDYFAHLFQYPSFRYLSSFGRRGESPEEMLSIENVRFHNHKVWALDSDKRELTKFSFSSSGDSLLRDETVALDEDVLRPLDFTICNDSIFFTPDYSGIYRFCFVKRTAEHTGELVNLYGLIPSLKKDKYQNMSALAQGWRSFFDYNPHKDIVVTATQLGEVLEIYNLKDHTYTVCIGKNGEPEFKISGEYGIPTGIMGFSDIQITDNAIYAVFQGITFKEIAQQKGEVPDGGKYIYVFSLEGEPICKYTLDHYISGIWVDEATKTIIATDVNSDQPIVKFSFD